MSNLIYIKRPDGGYTQVDKTTNPSYYNELLNNGAVEITEEEFNKETFIPDPQIDTKQVRIQEIKAELTELDKDFIQAVIGYSVPDLANRKARFNELYTELCALEGKEPRTKENEK